VSPFAPVRLNPEVPAELERIVNKGLEKDRDLRYQSASEIRADLKRLRRDTSSDRRVAVDSSETVPVSNPTSSATGVTQARGPSAAVASETMIPVPTVRPLWRSPWLFAGIATVGVIAVFAVWKFRSPFRPSGTTDATPMKISQLTTTGDVDVGVISPDGRLVAYVRQQHGVSSLWMLQLATGSMAQIAELATLASLEGGPRFSPDGNYIYFSTQAPGAPKATLFRVASLGGTPESVLDDVPSTIAFSPEAKQFAFIRRDLAKHQSYLLTAEADGSKVHIVATKKEPQAFVDVGPAWMPDGQHAAVVSRENVARAAKNIEVVDLKTGASAPLGNLNWNEIGRLSWRSSPDAIVFAGYEKLGNYREQIWELLYPSGELRQISNDLNSYFVPELTADGNKLVAGQLLPRAGLWLAPTSNPDSAKQITPGTTRWDGAGLSWTGNTHLIYAYIGGSNFRIATLELGGEQPADLHLPGEALL
jgi:eukaryotic-like serine/threonine-protein kinase